MIAQRGHIRFLASVRNGVEAEVVAAAGADIIDCKDPARGALGALDPADIRDIYRRVAGMLPVSATIGDLPLRGDIILDAVQNTAATGVEFVKVGLFDDRNTDVHKLVGSMCNVRLGHCRLVAVLLADMGVDLSLIPSLAGAGFGGVMLDTADKSAKALPQLLSREAIASFVSRVRAHGMFAGLAGGLRLADISDLRRLAPDVLGFRGALCKEGQRKSELDPSSVKAIRAALSVDRARVAAFA